MKIAVIMHVPLSEGGGGFYELKSQSEFLSRYGFEIHAYEPHSDLHPIIDANVTYKDYKSKMLDFFTKMGRPGAFPMFLSIKLAENYDIVYTFSPFYILFLFINRKSLKNTKKVIISTKDLLFPETAFKRVLRRITIILYRLLNMKNVYIYNENSIESFMLKGMSMKTYELGPLVNKNINGYNFRKNEQFTILFLGSVEKRKGADNLFKLLEECRNKDILFKIAGKISEDYIEIAKSFSCENIQFLGKIDEETKENLLFCSDLGLMLSIVESYSLVTREMLMHGLPLITTWIPATMIYGDYGIFLAYDFKEIYSKVLILQNEWLNSYENYIKRRERILKIANTIFNKKDLEREFLCIFLE